MPNWAFGNVKVTGTREGVKSFVERFISSDDQSTVPGKRFFARSFSEQKREQSVKDAMEEFEGKADNETAEHSFLIMFAWSVWSCMIDGYPQRNDAECITLSEACMEDHVAVEIRSTETGMCFEEHVTCDEDGATVVLACVEYDPDKDLLQTVVYGDCASDEPTAIAEHYNTDFED